MGTKTDGLIRWPPREMGTIRRGKQRHMADGRGGRTVLDPPPRRSPVAAHEEVNRVGSRRGGMECSDSHCISNASNLVRNSAGVGAAIFVSEIRHQEGIRADVLTTPSWNRPPSKSDLMAPYAFFSFCTLFGIFPHH